MTASRSAVALLAILTLVIMLACGACGTARPAFNGRVINSMKSQPVEPVEGVVITVQHATDENRAMYELPQPGDIIRPEPQILATAISGPDGTFSLQGVGQGFVLNVMPQRLFQLRFHRDDFSDSILNFFYDGGASFIFLDQKSLGPIPLRPNSANPPSTQPATVNVITLPQAH